MEYVLLMVRFGLLGLSLVGYLRLIGNRVRMEFAPGILFTGICSVMFFAGILNILQEAAWAVCAGGVWLTAQSFWRRESLRSFLCPGIGFLLLSAVVLLLFLRGETFGFYDDFSHWGTVTKVLYTRDRFPNYSDSVITFQSYPAGSAVFLYFFLTISGITSEWFQMYWQAVFMVGILTGLYVFVKGWLGSIFAAATAWILLLCCNGLNNLMVDTLIPVVALGGLCLCFCYGNDFGKKAYWLAPYLVSLVSIKNSGLLFVLLLLILAFQYMRKNDLRSWAVLCCVPAAALLLWQKHVLLVFDDGLLARHSLSTESITEGFLKKGTEQLQEVIRRYCTEVFSFENPVLLLLGVVMALAVAAKLLGSQGTEGMRVLAAFGAGGYLVYMVGLLAMYLTTMPYGEAVTLAAYGRYHRSILILTAGCVFLLASELIGELQGKGTFAIWILTAVISAYALFPGLWYSKPTIREDFEQLITENAVRAERRYCVVLEEGYAQKYSGYLQYLIRYLLNSADMRVCGIDAYEASPSGWEGYDYLICFGESAEMDEFLLRTTGSQEQRVLTRNAG